MNRMLIVGLMALTSVSVCYADTENILDESAVADTSKVVDLDEVVVVAQPKEGFLLRQQPLSSNVFGSKELQQMNVQGLGQLSYYVPSFTMPEYGSRLTSSMYIRGIGSRVNNSAVGIYYDHIPLMSKSAFNTHFYMLDRVDVLRGPQGTLYGANTEGGIVRIYSKNPMSYQGTDVNLGIGTGFTRKVELAHYHRPSEKVAFMVAGFYNGQRGIFKNTNLDEYNDKMAEAGAKVRLLWKPQTRLSFDLTSDYQYTNQNGFPYGLYDAEKEETADPSTTFMNNYRRQMVNTGLTMSYAFDRYLLTSTTSHQYLWDRMNMDQDYLPEDYMGLQQVQKMNALTQELVFRSNNASRWQHTSGLFGSYQWLHTNAPVEFGGDMISMLNQMLGRVMANVLPSGPQLIFKDFHIPGDFKMPRLNVAVFHESNIHLTDRLMATLGLRYEFDQVRNDYLTMAESNIDCTIQGRPFPIEYNSTYESSLKKNASQLLPKLGLTYNFDNEGNNIYAVFSKGYLMGGYNLQGFSDIFQTEISSFGANFPRDGKVQHTEEDVDLRNRQIAYDAETSWNYEAGAHLNLFSHKVQADVAFFYTRIRNQQISRMSPDFGYGRIIDNAGKSFSCGAELALRGQAFDNHLMWGTTYSFTHAKFKEYDDYDKSRQLISYEGKYVPFIPQHQFSVNGDYCFDVNKSLLKSVVLGVNVKGQGKTYWEANNNMYQKFYATLGAHFSLNMSNVIVDFWGRNLTNTYYNTFLVNSTLNSTSKEQSFAQVGLPLRVGFDVKLRF